VRLADNLQRKIVGTHDQRLEAKHPHQATMLADADVRRAICSTRNLWRSLGLEAPASSTMMGSSACRVSS